MGKRRNNKELGEMALMTLVEFIEMFVQYGVFAILFGWLFYDTRAETKDREERLLGQIDRLNESFQQIALILHNVEERLRYIEQSQRNLEESVDDKVKEDN